MEINELQIVELLIISFVLIFVTELVTISGLLACHKVPCWAGKHVVALLKTASC